MIYCVQQKSQPMKMAELMFLGIFNSQEGLDGYLEVLDMQQLGI